MNVPGGVRKGLTEEQRKNIAKTAQEFIEFAQFTLKIFKDVVLGNEKYVDIIVNGPYALNLHSMGLVDANNKVNFYDGDIRVVDTTANELYKYPATDYLDYIEERVEPWSYLKFPYLKKIGWKGFVDGQDSGVYHATPLSRLNAADGMATPLAHGGRLSTIAISTSPGALGKGAGDRSVHQHLEQQGCSARACRDAFMARLGQQVCLRRSQWSTIGHLCGRL